MIISYMMIALFVLIDVILKQVFSNMFQVGEVVSVIDHVLHVGYVQNTGASLAY